MHQRGVFATLYELTKRGELSPRELTRFGEAEAWLNENLSPPSRLEHLIPPDGRDVAMRWLKGSAVEPLHRMRDLAQLLEDKGVDVVEFHTKRPGRVVYEDSHQVVAIPPPRETV